MNLDRKGDEVTLRIHDNGSGFELGTRRLSGGLGLAGMETRARGCGGNLHYTTAPGKGVEIEVECPIAL